MALNDVRRADRSPSVSLYEIDAEYQVCSLLCSGGDYAEHGALPGSAGELVPESEWPSLRDALRRAIDHGEVGQIRYGVRDVGGSEQVFEARVSPACEAGSHGRARLALLDVTELAAENADLRRRNAELETLPDTYFRITPDGTILEYRSQAPDDLYVPPELFLGRRLHEVVPPHVSRLWDEHLPRTRAGEQGVAYTYELALPQGPQHFEARLSALPDSEDTIVVIRNITDRRRTELALLASEERFRRTVEQSWDMIALLDADTRVRYVNGSVERVLGLGVDDFVGTLGLDLVHPEDLEGARMTLGRLMAAPGKPLILALRARHGSGGWWWLEIAARNLLDAPGLEAIVISVRDVTERVHQQEALERAHREADLFRRMVDLSTQAIGSATLDARVMYMNPALLRLLGLESLEAARRHSYEDFYRPEDLEDLRSQIIPGVLSGGHWTGELELQPLDGAAPVPAIQSVYLVRDDEGFPIALSNVITDISAQKRAEQALLEEKERALVTLHSIGDAVITTDEQGRIDYLNPVAEVLTGWRGAEVLGCDLSAVFVTRDEESGELLESPIAQCLREGTVVDRSSGVVLVGRDGSEHDIDESAAPIRRPDGTILGAVLVFHDVTEARQLTRQMAHDAAHDPLTGLINRREFEDRLGKALASAQKYGAQHVLCYLDLDQFKVVNDSAGHAAGDELLKQIRVMLEGLFRDRDTLARLGGDEFGLLLDNCPIQRALSITAGVIDAIRAYRFVWEGRSYQVGASIGVTAIDRDTETVAQLLSEADVACYTAKELGRNRVHVYREQGGAPLKRHGEILQAAGLRDALECDRFGLFCQPIVPLRDAELDPGRFELLLRLLDAKGELGLPGAFIPAAERFGLMADLDRWVIRTAFRSYSKVFNRRPARISVNLSGGSLNDDSLLDYLRDELAASSLPPERVCFEITETAAVHDMGRAARFLSALKDLGCQLALDDFGSGLSSLRYLKALPVDYLKIDGSFIEGLADDAGDQAIVAAISQLAHQLGIRTIAEYASSERIIDKLRILGVDFAQGYAVGRPRPFSEETADPSQ